MIFVKKALNTIVGKLLLLAFIALSFTALVRTTYSAIVWGNNTRQISELNQRSLHRAEVLVDYAVNTMADLEYGGLGVCDAQAIKTIQRISFLRGSIKDIQVLDAHNGLLCAGAPMNEELDIAKFDFSDMYAAAEENIFFHDISRNNSGLLGIARHVSDDQTFLAVLNLDTLLFDVFPKELRDHARADLVMGGNVEVASQIPDVVPHVEQQNFKEFITASDRYPLEVRFTVDEAMLSSWNSELARLIGDVSLVIGLIMGWIILVLLVRPLTLREEMSLALKNGEFVPFMQPTFDIAGRKIVGCEVLMRWKKPDGEIVAPYQFIPAAEENGLIIPMTRAVMVAALSQLGDYMGRDKNFKMAFNIVPVDLVSDQFEADLCEIVKQAGVASRQVVLEITERQEFPDQDIAIARIKQLREMGFRVALDDTGVGHNGLSNVQQLGADIIKIDKIFIDRVGVDNAATTIVQMLVKLAQELGMRTVAEGIETEEQLRVLAECEVDEGQGYLVSKPVPHDEFIKLLMDSQQVATNKVAA